MSRDMAASRLPFSPAAEPPPLENDDLLDKILIRLPPLPSSLPRASAVCKRWRGLVSDPRFVRRFRAHHRRNPPLLGCFVGDFRHVRFQPALEPPNRVSDDGRFTIPIPAGDRFMILGCRHGLVLIFHPSQNRLMVWDPVTGDQHRLDIPPGFQTVKYQISGAVLRSAGDVQHFQLVLIGHCERQHTRAVASVYSSETGPWGNLISTPLPSDDSGGYLITARVYSGEPAVMVGDSLYWLVNGISLGILEFDLGRRRLGLIPMPGEESRGKSFGDCWVIPAECGGLGFLFLTGRSAQFWKRKTNCDGVASWVLGRTIALDKLFPIISEKKKERTFIIGFAEDNNVVLLCRSIGVFAVQLESLKFKKFSDSHGLSTQFYPFEGVYTTDKGIDGRHDGAGLLQNI